MGVLVCTNDQILFVIAGREKYDTVVEIQYKDIVDLLVPAWGANRRLIIKCKSNFYTFEVNKNGVVDKEGTYDFYRFITTKAGLEIKPGFEKKVPPQDIEKEKPKTNPIGGYNPDDPRKVKPGR